MLERCLVQSVLVNSRWLYRLPELLSQQELSGGPSATMNQQLSYTWETCSGQVELEEVSSVSEGFVWGLFWLWI